MKRIWWFMAVAVAVAAQVVPARTQPRAFTADDLFDDSRLHDLSVQLSDADWQQLLATFTENTFYRGTVEWRGMRVANVGVRSRGGATRSDRKPGLLLDFDRYVPGQTFLGLRALVLDNAWHDASLIKERVSMLLFRRLGVPAPREVHARLLLGADRRYGGLYVIVENVEDDVFLARHFNNDDGYLYEYERLDDYHFEDLGDEPGVHAKRFEPKTREKESPEEIFGPIRDFVRAVNASQPSGLAQAVEPYLDLDRFLTFLAVQNYLAVWDAFAGDLGMANFYVYRPAASTRFEFIPWDQDNTFTSLDFPPWYNVQKNVLTRKVWADDRLRERYLQRLMTVSESADGWLEKEIEREYRQIRPAVRADTAKYLSDEEFEKTIAGLRRFARERSRVVRDFLARVRSDANAQDLGH